MAVENLDTLPTVASKGAVTTHGGRVRYATATYEVAAAASANSTYALARVPSNAVILPISKLHYDDLASTGSPTIDVGLFNPSGLSGITDDDDALAANIDVATAAGSTNLVTDLTKMGKAAWEHVASQTADPNQELEIKATLKDAAANTGGTLTAEIYYTVD